MATDPLAMHALLEQLDQDLEAGKSYPDQAAQDYFFQRLITDTQLQNRSKSGQGALHTSKSLLEVLRYTLRGNKKAQYGPGGKDKKESQDALNHLFTIGSDMLKETYLAKIRAARPARSGVKTSNAINARAHQSTRVNGTEHDPMSRAMETTTTSAEHQILIPNSAPATQTYEPAPPQSKPQTINDSGRTSNKRKRHDSEDDKNGTRIKTEHKSSNTIILRIKDKRLLEAIESPGLSTRTEHPRSPPPRFPYGLPTPSLSPPPPLIPRAPIISRLAPLGCVSQAEVLEDIRSITTAITSFLGTPQVYSASSPDLATLLGNGTYVPSSSHLSCSPVCHDAAWEWLIENILSPDLPSASPFLGISMDASVQRAIEMTERSRVLDADGIVRELALAQLRDPEFVVEHGSGPEAAWTKICQMAWRLKGKMSVSRDKLVIVRDLEKRCTGVAMKQEMRYGTEDDELERALCLWRPAV
ncbi:hypothetical protein AC578_3110 [Pseudocercospora eumusae]|uniref:Uncharacterized protein n=1 Tax=Pseudocercospora eumusae TaxID=321146 RepID=A0A139H6C1_9PEZI|nr:hypothetical protein AC578_3110 [Pseudocercospora eumusae]